MRYVNIRGQRLRHRGLEPRSGNLLVVNADDYGLTRATSEAILTAHREGIVTSTSVLVLAPGFAPTVGWLASEPGIGVGVHLALVGEDAPLLTAAEVPTLVDGRGRLARSWRALLPRLIARRVDPADIRRELAAQIQSATDVDLQLDHLDTHQHLHLWPAIGDVVLSLAAEHGIGAVRTPWSATAGPRGLALRRLALRWQNRARTARLVTSDVSAGLDEAGHGTPERLLETVRRLGVGADHVSDRARCRPSVAELGCHPGASHDPERVRYQWGYRWADELAGLTSQTTRQAVMTSGFRLVRWADVSRSPID